MSPDYIDGRSMSKLLERVSSSEIVEKENGEKEIVEFFIQPTFFDSPAKIEANPLNLSPIIIIGVVKDWRRSFSGLKPWLDFFKSQKPNHAILVAVIDNTTNKEGNVSEEELQKVIEEHKNTITSVSRYDFITGEGIPSNKAGLLACYEKLHPSSPQKKKHDENCSIM